MEETKKVFITGAVFIALIAIGFGVYFLFIHDKSEQAPAEEIGEKKLAEAPLEEPLKEEEAPEFIDIELDQSDDVIRKLIQELSSHPELAAWLVSKDLIRKFVAAVDNIANGLSPRPQVDFFSPKGGFKFIEKKGLLYVNPASYSRYDTVADIFLSLNSEGCATLYRRVEPLIQEAYKDLGYPEGDFRKTLTRAIVELLGVPVVEGDILIEKKVITYKISDPKLERLSGAQKHLFRMGPENIRIIQEKLREMASTLGIPEEQLQ
ncbi:MAG: DUF3014 domain-containing protein [Candidatus Aminicenantes bacterium]|nr:MAG: DUF3014 domain-containing protein [Candidatus Aminicenantes bacterium]